LKLYRAQGLLNTCAATYRGQFNRPAFQYRYGPVDPDFPTACADADASVSGLTFYQGKSAGRGHYFSRFQKNTNTRRWHGFQE
jgi:hypothetical protein